ncbi:MAG: HD domain-containing protein [Peptococcaceae bacterium]
MLVNIYEEKIWLYLKKELSAEKVAGLDHIKRTLFWAKKLGQELEADMEVLIPGVMLHDIGVTKDRKKHYQRGIEPAEKILREIKFPDPKISGVLHVIESHSRYGGPTPKTLEAKIMWDIDAIDYVGAVGITRAVVRGLSDNSFDGNVFNFPALLKNIVKEVEDKLYFKESKKIIQPRIEFLSAFVKQLEIELSSL